MRTALYLKETAMKYIQIWRCDALCGACEQLRLHADVWETQPGAEWVWMVDTEYGEGGLSDAFLVGKASLATLLTHAEQEDRDPDRLWEKVAQMSQAMESVTSPAWEYWSE